ncbi:putative xylanase/chitin deacetylase [Desulfosporosinus orientis DSM 765]|uniref:Putative xylanase/chitin deacetylase n=1 Tax=Desulfosporosinus orientis (strain ATCC 19365 / DSM 765 / NCIMB 8382 / VKM B-1628 / Singapore I) TaxID=768706 RepID=G7WE22_DESOD|nr:polysaccharide deacetylase family protein [Desulfosporosinus orientis]AET69420.1 putative xylanase/chitin deacetylase [Desulfosporosinus orientis DSM 765]
MSKIKILGSVIFLVCFLVFTVIGVGMFPHWSKATQTNERTAVQLKDSPAGDKAGERVEPSSVSLDSQPLSQDYPEEPAPAQVADSLPPAEAEEVVSPAVEPQPGTEPSEEVLDQNPVNSESPSKVIAANTQPEELAPTPLPGTPDTPVHPYYDEAGNPPTAPGLAMRERRFNPEEGKMAYLTFDDGPYPSTTPKILAILAEENVRATFFDLGKQAELYPDLLKAEYEQNHAIGNHTYSHNMAEVYMSPQDFLADVKKAEEIFYQTIGIRPQIVRAPGGTVGHFNINYFNAVDAEGYLMEDWNVDPGDTRVHLMPADQLVQQVEEQIQGKERVVILLHDLAGKDTTIEALPKIIKILKDQGFSFGVLDPHVRPVVFPAGLTQ